VLEHSHGNDVQRSRVVSSGGTGLLLSSSNQDALVTNEVMTSGDGGLVLQGSTSNALSGNRATATRWGTRCRWGSAARTRSPPTITRGPGEGGGLDSAEDAHRHRV
jgi:parallel beta-helix repeat protein